MEKSQQYSLLGKKLRRIGKREKVIPDTGTFLQPKAKSSDKTSPPPMLPIMNDGESGNDKPIESHLDVHKLLCKFDLNLEYGPCIGLSRLERWERAHTLGLHPPAEIKSFLADPSHQECLFAKMCL